MKKIFLTTTFVFVTLLTQNACVPLVAAGAGSTAVAVAQERTVGSAVDDSAIKAKLVANYADRSFENMFIDVNSTVYEGRVMLTGKVKRQETALEAVRIAWEIEGVKEVINEIQVVSNQTFKNTTSDIYLKSRIKGQFLLDKDIRSVNYTIEVMNGVVYVFGIAQSRMELDKVLRICQYTPGITKVVNHARLKTDPQRLKHLN